MSAINRSIQQGAHFANILTFCSTSLQYKALHIQRNKTKMGKWQKCVKMGMEEY